jgi:hypothetical protein
MPRAWAGLFEVPHWKGANEKIEGGRTKMSSVHLKDPVVSSLSPNSRVFQHVVNCFVLLASSTLWDLVWWFDQASLLRPNWQVNGWAKAKVLAPPLLWQSGVGAAPFFLIHVHPWTRHTDLAVSIWPAKSDMLLYYFSSSKVPKHETTNFWVLKIFGIKSTCIIG